MGSNPAGRATALPSTAPGQCAPRGGSREEVATAVYERGADPRREEGPRRPRSPSSSPSTTPGRTWSAAPTRSSPRPCHPASSRRSSSTTGRPTGPGRPRRHRGRAPARSRHPPGELGVGWPSAERRHRRGDRRLCPVRRRRRALGPEAAARLHERAVADDSDVVLGRSVGHGRPNSSQLSWRTRGPVRFEEDPGLISHLKTHKLMRRASSTSTGCAFPRASGVSKTRSSCSRPTSSRGHLGRRRLRLLSPPSATRPRRASRRSRGSRPTTTGRCARTWRSSNATHSRARFGTACSIAWSSNEMLKRLSGPLFLSADPRRQQGLLREIRSILDGSHPAHVDETLIPPVRTVAALARADRLDLLVAVGRGGGPRRGQRPRSRRAELAHGRRASSSRSRSPLRDAAGWHRDRSRTRQRGGTCVAPASIDQIVPRRERPDGPADHGRDRSAGDRTRRACHVNGQAYWTFVEAAGPDGGRAWRARAAAFLPLSAVLPGKRRADRAACGSSPGCT